MKKIISVLLSVLMLFTTITAVPFVSSAKDKTRYGQNDKYEYCVINEKTVTITKYKDKNYAGEIVIPSKIEGKRVTIIGEDSFISCEEVTSIKIPDTVVEIKIGAFAWCYKLNNISLPDSIKIIGNAAFAKCLSLESIKIPDSVTSIGESAFDCCYSLTSIKLPKNLKYISNELFAGCESLTNISLPDSVTEVGEYAFFNCSFLENINIQKKLQKLVGVLLKIVIHCQK